MSQKPGTRCSVNGDTYKRTDRAVLLSNSMSTGHQCQVNPYLVLCSLVANTAAFWSTLRRLGAWDAGWPNARHYSFKGVPLQYIRTICGIAW